MNTSDALVTERNRLCNFYLNRWKSLNATDVPATGDLMRPTGTVFRQAAHYLT
jgi:hypothetical protein